MLKGMKKIILQRNFAPMDHKPDPYHFHQASKNDHDHDPRPRSSNELHSVDSSRVSTDSDEFMSNETLSTCSAFSSAQISSNNCKNDSDGNSSPQTSSSVENHTKPPGSSATTAKNEEQSLRNLARTSSNNDWFNQFKTADFGSDYTLRPRLKRPRYDLQTDGHNYPNRPTERKTEPATSHRKLVKKGSQIPSRKEAATGTNSTNKKLLATTVGNGISCVCLSSWDVGPQIECERCGSWQHVLCVGMFGKETKDYRCHICDPDRSLPNSNHEEALKAFSAYAFLLPVAAEVTDESQIKIKPRKVPRAKKQKRVPKVQYRETSEDTVKTSEPENPDKALNLVAKNDSKTIDVGKNDLQLGQKMETISSHRESVNKDVMRWNSFPNPLLTHEFDSELVFQKR